MPAEPPTAPPTEWGPPQHKTIFWYDVSVVQELTRGLSGREFLQGILEGRFPPPPISQVAASRLTWVGDGEAEFACIPDASFLNPMGLVHGGLLCTLMDTAMGVAVHSTLPAGVGTTSVELKVSFLKPLPYDGRELRIHGRALQVGRRIAFAEAHAYDPSNRLIGHATSSLAVVKAARPSSA